MTEPEGFLDRWSRRKLGPADKDAVDTANVAPANVEAKPEPAADAAVEFDVGKLPPLDSITAASDLTPFLEMGVPSALRHAALRRAWSADPAIRDFIGLNENFWDAAGIDAAPGFGALDPGLDIKMLIANMFGESMPAPERASTKQTADERTADERSEPVDTARQSTDGDMQDRNIAPPNAPTFALQADQDAACDQDTAQQNVKQGARRRHGGAIPR
jgi:hypothetical protein